MTADLKPDRIVKNILTAVTRCICNGGLGDYEASSDAILYEVDPEYRRKIKKQQIAEEKTFGASLRRLRIQKELSRNDFAPLTAKTIARIERGEVEKPHGKTLQAIAKRLGVEPEDIETY